MNTDMNQYLIFRYASTVVRKMTVYQLCCAELACLSFVLTEHISSYYRVQKLVAIFKTCIFFAGKWNCNQDYKVAAFIAYLSCLCSCCTSGITVPHSKLKRRTPPSF